MSTRCQIEFMNVSTKKEKKGPKEGNSVKMIRRRTVYRHSDGYPESVIPDLKEFLKWNGGRNFDLECQAANFIYWSKKRQEEQLKRNLVIANYANFPKTRKQMLLSGYGICNNDEFHGDIAFYYEVISDTIKGITIKCYQLGWPVPERKEDFKLISTEKIKFEACPIAKSLGWKKGFNISQKGKEENMKIYKGKRVRPSGGFPSRESNDVIVTVNGKPLKHQVYHSPTGMEWGYLGSGPADLARSILWDHLGKEPARNLYQDFKDTFVAAWEDEWQITSQEIQNWIDKRREQK